jgi:recombination protein RecR
MAYPRALEELIQAFERFPGIGRRSAERLAFHVLRDDEARGLARAIDDAVAQVKRCSVCGNVTEHEPCAICGDDERDRSLILVVEEPRQVEAMERAAAWKGLYHVLYGALNAAEGTEVRHLSIPKLVQRARSGAVHEVCLGMDPDAEGEATALACLEPWSRCSVTTCMSRGWRAACRPARRSSFSIVGFWRTRWSIDAS